jgi:hypothetical protein
LSTTVEKQATLEKGKERNISGLKSGADKPDQKAQGGNFSKNFKLENKWYPQRSIAARIRIVRKRKGRDRWRL